MDLLLLGGYTYSSIISNNENKHSCIYIFNPMLECSQYPVGSEKVELCVLRLALETDKT